MVRRFLRLTRVGFVLAFTSALFVVPGLVPNTGNAEAAPRENVVVFGDSFSTNPEFFFNVGSGCHESPTAWPRHLDRTTNKRVNNFACAGTSLAGEYNLYDQARKARGAINKNTRAVLIQLGFNDFGSGLNFMINCYIVGCPGGVSQFPRLRADVYAARLKPMVDYVRYYAPRAKVAIVGYPDIYGDRPDICSTVPGGAQVSRPGTSAHPAFMRKLDVVQADAARRLGIPFVSLMRVTKGHGTCSSDPWINGYFHPFEGLQTGIQGHPTGHGDVVAARTIKRQLSL